jgi:ribosomal protein L37AE/L43A
MEDELVETRSDIKREKILCPKCGSSDVRRSNQEGLLVSVNSMMGRWPFRCRSCRNRFFRHANAPQEH